jgi:trk system potassium uptake protein
MHLSISLRIVGVLLMVFSSAMVIPLGIALWEQEDSAILGFAVGLSLNFLAGFALWLPTRNVRHDLRIRDGFLITAMFWTVLGVSGALPMILTERLEISVTDAIFESISGLTTTGATVITGLDELPLSILFYRQLLQWLGGIGIIVVAVAVLPMLGIGGMQLYRAEIPGPTKDNKLTPRIAETAKALFLVYVALTTACALAYFAVGMNTFDAIAHALSTVAIGGFSTYDASLGHFESDGVLLVATVFMVFAGINFGLHFTVWRRRLPGAYWRDSEARFYINVIAIGALITVAYLAYTGTFTPGQSVVQGLFHAVSITTTTGFGAAEFSAWPTFLPMMLLMFSFMGGCVGSTGGGVKAMRLMMIYKQGVRELKQLVHPNAIIPLKIGRHRVDAKIVSAVWSFLAVYLTVFIVLMLLLMAMELDFLTAFSGVAATLNNLGPGLGEFATNYSSAPDPAKWLMCAAMLLGRLEVFTLLVLFTPAFWRL